VERAKIIVSEDVLAGLEAVRLSGKTNMFDRPRVIELAFEMGYDAAAIWLGENKRQYAEGIFRGFAAAEPAPPSNRDCSPHDGQHGVPDDTVGEPSDECQAADTGEGGDSSCVDR